MSDDVRGSTAVEDRSIGQLVQDLTEQTRRLVRDELRLATAELKAKGKHAGVGMLTLVWPVIAAMIGRKQVFSAIPPVPKDIQAVRGGHQHAQ